MRFRQDRERYIGGYDPEHEMPDPDRRPRDRWQSEAYRDQAHDSRYAYRWNPDRFEERRAEWHPRDRHDYIQPRNRYEPYGYARANDRGWPDERDFGPPRRFDPYY